jgi:hypothetical protein
MAYSPCRLAAKVGPDGQWWQTIGADKVEGLVMERAYLVPRAVRGSDR